MSSQPPAPRVLSGIQPTAGSFHLGNYLGAVKQWVTLQEMNDAFYCVVDLHALTLNPPPPAELTERTLVSVAQLLAAGLDPDRCTLFLQGHVPGHTQLAWIMECLTGYGEAGRMTQFKDKSSRGGADRVTVGLFTYPILQVADILLYQANYVPVGEDQRQHLELTRNLAQRFNSRYGDTFVVPDPYILKATAKILDLQDPTAKMSKSLGEAGTVNLLDDPSVSARKIRRAVTDVEAEFSGGGYGSLKVAVADAVAAFAEPFAKRTAELLDDRTELGRILARGAERANEVAAESVRAAYERVGLVAPMHP